MKSVLVPIVNCFTPNNWSLARKMPVSSFDWTNIEPLNAVSLSQRTTTLVVTILSARKSSIWCWIASVNWLINALVFKDFSSSTASEVNRPIDLPVVVLTVHLSFRWYWIGFHLVVDGTSQCGLREEIQTGIRCLPCSTNLDCCRWTVQFHFDYPHHFGTFRLCLHGR